MGNKKANAAAQTATPAAKKTRQAKPLPVLEGMMARLFTPREVARLDNLSADIISLRARARELMDRADAGAREIYILTTGTKEEISPERAGGILSEIEAFGETAAPFGGKVRDFAQRHRASAKLAQAKAEFEAFHEIANGTATAAPESDTLGAEGRTRLDSDEASLS